MFIHIVSGDAAIGWPGEVSWNAKFRNYHKPNFNKKWKNSRNCAGTRSTGWRQSKNFNDSNGWNPRLLASRTIDSRSRTSQALLYFYAPCVQISLQAINMITYLQLSFSCFTLDFGKIGSRWPTIRSIEELKSITKRRLIISAQRFKAQDQSSSFDILATAMARRTPLSFLRLPNMTAVLQRNGWLPWPLYYGHQNFLKGLSAWNSWTTGNMRYWKASEIPQPT